MSGTKECSRCCIVKPWSAFTKKRASKDGLLHECKTCERERRERNKEANAERSRKWRAENPEANKAMKNKWYLANKDHSAAKGKQWRAANAESEATRRKKWSVDNPERQAEIRKRWVTNNPEANKAAKKKWAEANYEAAKKARSARAKANPEKGRANTAKRRARKHNAEQDGHTYEDLLAYWYQHGIDPETCWLKGPTCTGVSEHQAHIMPLARGGPHTKQNIKPTCARCNWSQGDKLLTDWLKGLHDEGKLTDDEYEAKRKALTVKL